MARNTFYKEKNYPVSVVKSKNAQTPEGLTIAQGTTTIMEGGYVVYDMGKGSVGGYPVFVVRGYKGKPSIRISYSDRRTTYDDEATMDKGDFKRGCCTYLGVELPVSPANPYRYEDYTINRTGMYVQPMIQGQERFVMICVAAADESTVDAHVTLEAFYIVDDCDKADPVGQFVTEDEKLNKLWLASANTLRLATVQANQFEMVEGRMCLRKLTKYRSDSLIHTRPLQNNVQIDATFELSQNPEHETGITFLFWANRENDVLSGYSLDITQTGDATLYYTENGKKARLATPEPTDGPAVFQLKDNYPYTINISADTESITVLLPNNAKIHYEDNIKTQGYFGLACTQERRSIIDRLNVTSNGEKIYSLEEGTKPFDICRTGFFISDGAKRDRIPWSGDLDWAFDSGWYSYGQRMKAENTLDILGYHTNPEGYIFAACYPENTEKPIEKEYGYYQSDMFAAWYVISVLTYGKFAGYDKIQKYGQKMRDCLDYLWQYVDKEDGLFYQRYETSKGLWDHKLGDTGKNTYTNLIICDAMQKYAAFAAATQNTTTAANHTERAQIMHRGIMKHLYSEEKKGFIKSKEIDELCDMANPYAMCKNMVTKEQAAQIASHAKEITHGYGKIALLMIHGLYNYGYGKEAWEMLTGRLPLYGSNGQIRVYVDWMSTIDNPNVPETTYECMHNPPSEAGANLNWGDLCHPDTTICGVLTGKVAGIMPGEEGFSSILLRPCPGNIKNISCLVPVKNGKTASLKISENENDYTVELELPEHMTVTKDFSQMTKNVIYTERIVDGK